MDDSDIVQPGDNFGDFPSMLEKKEDEHDHFSLLSPGEYNIVIH